MKTLPGRFFSAAAVALLILPGADAARADIIYIGPSVVQPAGQGVVQTVLTLQENGPAPARDGIETGGVRRVNGGDQIFGDAKPGVNSKTILFTQLRNEAGILNASQLGIFLDIVEPGNDNLLTIEGRNSLVLTAYKNDGTVLERFFYTGEFRNLGATPGPGGGRSDHAFALDSLQAARLQALIDANPDLRLGLEATLGSAFGGPDHFFFGRIQAPPQPVPEPTTLLLLGTGMAGIVARYRRKRKAETDRSGRG